MVVSLPTSAGKTGIAELCILRCLAGGKRVVFVTPLRALSAQTETSAPSVLLARRYLLFTAASALAASTRTPSGSAI
ncbi:DEAD/DEAH box helicase [Bradyrhizobium sp. JR4.1]|uniref:DEAD/DEAH box helicase n=1 Tax=Bradyrhizobium sp. JR4.1 TaxID=3156372 RepID=UPI003395B145